MSVQTSDISPPHTGIFGKPSRIATLDEAVTRMVLFAEWLFVLAVIIVFSEAILHLLLVERGETFRLDDGHPLLRRLFMLIYALAVPFILLRWRSVGGVAVGNVGNLALVLLALTSTLWSVDPDLTLRRATALGLTTLLGWYLVAAFSVRGLLKILGFALGAALILSVVTVVVMPQYGIASGATEGAWRGVFFHKNLLGKAAALAFLVYVALWIGDGQKCRYAAGSILAALLIVMADSKSALLVTGATVTLVPFIFSLRHRAAHTIPIISMAIVVAIATGLLITSSAETTLELLGREATLTGRVPLWRGIIDAGLPHAWLGTGYSAFWVEQSIGVAHVQDMAGWRARGSHSGFLDLWLELGLVGIAMVVIMSAHAVRRSVASLRRSQQFLDAFPAILIIFLLLYGITEGGILKQNNLYWLMFVTAVGYSGKSLPEWSRPDSARGDR
jgi:exopolysaccharide production protein ExoQ